MPEHCRRAEIPEKTNRLFVVDRESRHLGEIRLADLLTGGLERKVAELMLPRPDAIDAATPAHEVARLFEQHNLITAPVVDGAGGPIGRISIDDVPVRPRRAPDLSPEGRGTYTAPMASSAGPRA